MELAKLLVPSIISVIGFVITIIVMVAQFKNAKKQKITDAQRQLYLETYVDVEKIVAKNELIFEPSYYDTIFSRKGEIKLSASNEVIHEYENLLKYVHSIAWPTWKWISENHPEGNDLNYETRYDDETGEELEICHITEGMLDQFQYDYEKYKEEHMPDSKEVKKHVESLLNKMRKDLGNDVYTY